MWKLPVERTWGFRTGSNDIIGSVFPFQCCLEQNYVIARLYINLRAAKRDRSASTMCCGCFTACSRCQIHQPLFRHHSPVLPRAVKQLLYKVIFTDVRNLWKSWHYRCVESWVFCILNRGSRQLLPTPSCTSKAAAIHDPPISSHSLTEQVVT